MNMLKGLLVLVLLAALAVGGLLFWVDPEEHRDDITRIVGERLGVEVRLGGLQLSLWPTLGLATEQLQVLQPRQFGDGVFLEAGQVQVSTALLPLLQGRVELGEIRLQGVRLKLERSADGQRNWDLLSKGESSGSRPIPAGDGGTRPVALKLAGLYLDDVQVDYEDRQSGSRQRFSIETLKLVGLGGAEPASLQLNARANLPDPYSLSLNAAVALSEAMDRLRLASLNLELKGEALPVPLTVEGTLEADLNNGQVKLAPIRILEGLRIEGRVGPDIRLSVTADGLDLSDWAEALPEQQSTLEMELVVEGTPAAVGAQLKRLVLGPVDMQGTLHWKPQGITADLRLKALDLDALMKAEEAAGGNSTAASPLLSAADLPALHSDWKLALDGLKVRGLQLGPMRMLAQTRPGRVQLKLLDAELYQGRLQAEARLRAEQQHVVLQTRGRLAGVRTGPLLQDLAGKPWITGEGAADWVLTSRLDDMNTLKNQLNGEARVQFTDGAVLGINVAERIREGWALLKGQPYTAPTEPPKTDFAELSASITARAGRLDNRNLLLQSPLLRITGEGWLDLAAEEVDYRLSPVLVGTLLGQQGEPLEQLKGVKIPLRIRGPIGQPEIRLDLARAFTERQKKKLKKKAEKEVMKLLFGKPKQKEEQPPPPPTP